MRKTAIVLGLFATAATWSMAQAAVVTYKANLSAAAEVPPVQTAGRGAAAVNVDTTTGAVSWNVEYSGLTGPAAAAHIHCGAGAGANAGVAVPLGAGPNLPNPITGSGKMTPAQLTQLQAGQCYVNIHTAANKGGEIRGQLAP
jgi:CHRD domain-containing protein